MKFKILPLFVFLVSQASFSQEMDGYWDKERITNKEIKLSAGDKIVIKSEDLPIGTTEFVYRITLLDENQKMVGDLASVLKSIPDPYYIGKGAGGALSLASAISGSDTCTYGIFTDSDKASDYAKSGDFKKACLYQPNPVSKDVKVVSMQKSTCLTENTRILWFAFENKNWIMNEKIVLEIVPWVDKKASRGWSQDNRKIVSGFIKTSETALRLPNPDAFCFTMIEKIQKEYKFQEFQKLSATEKNVVLAKFEDAALAETNNTQVFNKIIRMEAKTMALQGKFENALQLLNEKIIEKGKGTALDYNSQAEQYIFTRQFEKALKSLKIAEKIDPSELLVQLNLAHTYMFLDNMAACREIHQKFKEQNVSANQTWKNKTINDLDTFQKANLPSDDFKKVLRLMD
ncbi:tetratricopeptide repeat protein [Flavobacterium humi]|uniref:Tetratricopeptide repeat protein n=1 Tax=Flavobacterium humi TaxID=2562683 RepID=A0A4Z0L9Q1_9FLAO|nr:hypothetical protein [Flavobacterium humi]TGD59029.1 hypothetical protein E4635_04035 [Flavobacterium humi]